MVPPTTLNLPDEHGGFTAEVPTMNRRTGAMDGSPNSLWRPGNLLTRGTEGTLISYDEASFYQSNRDVTLALYKAPGYRYRVMVWFDNRDGRRIA